MTVVWDELGISETDDEKAIRRAYAVRLRAIDAEGDIAAFQRLRAAYDRALAHVRRPKAGPVALAAEPPPEATGERPPPLLVENQIALDSFGEQFGAALKANDVRGALALCDQASARGIIPLGLRAVVVDRIMGVAVQDLTIPPDDFDALMKRVGWNTIVSRGEGMSRARIAAMERMDANSWYRELRATAAEYFWKIGPLPLPGYAVAVARRAKRRNARLLVWGISPLIHASQSGAVDLKSKIEQANHYGKWLNGRISRRAMTLAKASLWFDRWFGRLVRAVFWVAPVVANIVLLAWTNNSPAAALIVIMFVPILITMRYGLNYVFA